MGASYILYDEDRGTVRIHLQGLGDWGAGVWEDFADQEVIYLQRNVAQGIRI